MKSEPPTGKTEPTGPFNWPSGYQKMAPCTMNTLFSTYTVKSSYLHHTTLQN